WNDAPAQPRSRCVTVRGLTDPALDVADREHLVLADTAGRLDFGDISRGLADQRARDGRIDRDLARLDIGFVVAHDLIAHFGAGFKIFELDRGAENDAALGVDLGGIDDV